MLVRLLYHTMAIYYDQIIGLALIALSLAVALLSIWVWRLSRKR